ncbi:MAG: TetR/AcrR family transcriptional regulator [Polyangiales bacterium]
MGRPRSDIDERVLRAAGQRFLNDGVDGASLREIARDAGTSVGMVTYYFPTKDSLFAAVVERAYAGLLDDFAAAFAPDVDFEAQIARLHRRVAALTEEEFLVMRLVLRELLLSSPRTPALLARFSRGHIPIVLGSMQQAYADGAIRGELPPAAVVLSLLTTALGVQIAARLVAGLGHEPFANLDPLRLADSVRELLFRGLAPRGGRDAP